MKVKLKRLSSRELFKSMVWVEDGDFWDPRDYKRRVLNNEDRFDASARALQLESVESRAFFKSSISRISFSSHPGAGFGAVDMELVLLNEDESEWHTIKYELVDRVVICRLFNMLVDAIVLGFELLQDEGLVRHAISLVSDGTLVIYARSISYERHAV